MSAAARRKLSRLRSFLLSPKRNPFFNMFGTLQSNVFMSNPIQHSNTPLSRDATLGSGVRVALPKD